MLVFRKILCTYEMNDPNPINITSYQRVINVSFSENFVNLLDELFLSTFLNNSSQIYIDLFFSLKMKMR